MNIEIKIAIRTTSSNFNFLLLLHHRLRVTVKFHIPLCSRFQPHLSPVLLGFWDQKGLSLFISLWYGEALRQACPLHRPQSKEHSNPAFLHPYSELQSFLKLHNIVLNCCFKQWRIHCHYKFQEFITQYPTPILRFEIMP